MCYVYVFLIDKGFQELIFKEKNFILNWNWTLGPGIQFPVEIKIFLLK
jgi:hypothetical protein